jgi:hypothetical protein
MMDLKKILALGVILLFIGVAVAPSINMSVVKASNDNDLVEVTTQACGIKGYGNTTMRLTSEQYQDLEQYLVEFRARLNQTTTREEVIPIFKEAVVEFNKYGLLPKGMSVVQTQRLVTGWNRNEYQKILNKQQEIFSKFINVFCLLSITATEDENGNLPMILPLSPLFFIYLPLLPFILKMGGQYLRSLALFFGGLIWINPIKILNFVEIFDYFTDCHSFGLKGAVESDNVSALLGFTGLLFFTFGDKAYFLGSALAVV